MADKFHSDTQEKVETLVYKPDPQDSGDLEAGTKTITATSEASGLGNADYSTALTLTKPDDARLIVKRIAARLAVTIDSFDTATNLYCRVYVDAQDADHRLFDEDWDSIGAKLNAVNTHSGAKATIFDLLKDGSAHTFYFFFWVNQANNAVISLVQLWEGVGSCDTNVVDSCLDLNFSGVASLKMHTGLKGTGATQKRIAPKDQKYYPWALGDVLHWVCRAGDFMQLWGSVATDLNYLAIVIINLRSEQ